MAFTQHMQPSPICQTFSTDDVIVMARPTDVLLRHGGLIGLAVAVYDNFVIAQIDGPPLSTEATSWVCRRGHLLSLFDGGGPKGRLP